MKTLVIVILGFALVFFVVLALTRRTRRHDTGLLTPVSGFSDGGVSAD